VEVNFIERLVYHSAKEEHVKEEEEENEER
jgi:hypothetical protein